MTNEVTSEELADKGTKIVRFHDSKITYIQCNSPDSFDVSCNNLSHDNKSIDENENLVQPTTRKLSPAEVNKTLKLNLGLPINPENSLLLRVCYVLEKIFRLVEKYGIMLWIAVPLRFRHYLAIHGWKLYFRIHQRCLGNSTAIHTDASDEYHALTSAMWWGNLFPTTLFRIRYALNQIQVIHPPSSALVKSSTRQVEKSITTKVYRRDVNDKEVLLGYFIQISESKVSDKAIFWIYGGAYLGGDCEGNAGIAEKIGKECNADVFLPNYRLLPEFEYLDAVNDVHDAYVYFLDNYHYKPCNVKLFGISSGGGLAVCLLQLLCNKSKNVSTNENENRNGKLDKMPSGAVLVSPFVDYTEPKGTFKEYYKHDLIVNRAVYKLGIPFLKIKLGSDENRRDVSPVYGSFEGLPPLCVVVSEHECVYDQVIMLVNNARKAGVNCSLGVWKYMCHVFPMLSPFIPEGKQCWNFMCDWMKSH